MPNYIIFEPESGLLEAYGLTDAQQRFWIDELGLALGVWQGSRENRPGYWLRW